MNHQLMPDMGSLGGRCLIFTSIIQKLKNAKANLQNVHLCLFMLFSVECAWLLIFNSEHFDNISNTFHVVVSMKNTQNFM